MLFSFILHANIGLIKIGEKVENKVRSFGKMPVDFQLIIFNDAFLVASYYFLSYKKSMITRKINKLENKTCK